MDDVSHLLLLLVSPNCEVTTKEDGEDKGGVELLKDNEHPVKVGLSDAYIIDRTIFCKCRRIMIRLELLKIMQIEYL